jgi:lysozyme
MNRPIALAAVLALALGGAAVIACSDATQRGDGATQSSDETSPIGGGNTDASTDAAPPRRGCPSAQQPDGGWVVLEGIDTSDYEYADWDAITAQQPNLAYSFLRVSSGLVRTDTRFHADWPAAARVGLVRGAYQYFTPRQSASAQADLFLQTLGAEGGLLATDLPPVVDVETLNGLPTAVVSCKLDIWLAKVERELGRVPIIYTSASFSSVFSADKTRYPLWVANYVTNPLTTCPRMPDPWPTWQFWQHSESGSVNGLYQNGDRDGGGSIGQDDAGAPALAGSDMNYFNGTRDDLDALIANSISSDAPADPAPPNAPLHVSTPDGGAAPDCSDGCCVLDP